MRLQPNSQRLRPVRNAILAAMIATAAAGTATPATASVIALDITARGWIDQTGLGNSVPGVGPQVMPFDKLRNYIAGTPVTNPLQPRITYRNFFVFDLSSLDGPIVSARLSLFNPPFGYSSPDATETYAVFDVTADILDLVRHVDEANGTALYDDLGTGAQFGMHTASNADDTANVEISLNAAALAALNAAAGLFAFGGALTTLDETLFSAFLFAGTGFDEGPGTTQLIVETATPVPEPGSAYLFGSGCVLLALSAMLARRQRGRTQPAPNVRVSASTWR